MARLRRRLLGRLPSMQPIAPPHRLDRSEFLTLLASNELAVEELAEARQGLQAAQAGNQELSHGVTWLVSSSSSLAAGGWRPCRAGRGQGSLGRNGIVPCGRHAAIERAACLPGRLQAEAHAEEQQLRLALRDELGSTRRELGLEHSARAQAVEHFTDAVQARWGASWQSWRLVLR
jgi:hypothetical protein